MAGHDLTAQARQARTAYLSAARRLSHALGRFDESGTAMDPGPDPDNPLPWTRDQVQIMRQVGYAFREVLEFRERWDRLRRDAASPYRVS